MAKLQSLSIAVADACTCCDEEIHMHWKWGLHQLIDQVVPPRGVTRSVRVIVREVAEGDALGEESDEVICHLERVAAGGFGRRDDDGVLSIPGVVVHACGFGH